MGHLVALKGQSSSKLKYKRRALFAQQGFTLIELIVVIVVLGIMSVGLTQFIVNSSQGYVDTARRERQGSAARVAVEKVSRELRNALPNSIHTFDNGNCIEFIPTLGGSIYIDLPIGSSSSVFSSVPLEAEMIPDMSDDGWVGMAVYPIDKDELYSLTTSSPIASLTSAAVASLNAPTEVAVSFKDPSHSFPLGSPYRRWFLISDPVSFCLVTANKGKLFRYNDYNFIDDATGPSDFPIEVPKRRLLAKGVGKVVGTDGSSLPIFSVLDASLQRNSLVHINLRFSEGVDREPLDISHEVQLRNVP